MNRRFTPLRRTWRQLSSALLDVVLPPACASCGTPAEVLCDLCRRRLTWRRDDGCRRCGAALIDGGRCRSGHDHLRHVAQLLAPLRFAGTGGRLVRSFKLDGNASAGRWLARAMANCYRVCADPGRPLVVSVPLHRARRRRRGFDQADWLARAVASRLGLRLGSGVLARNRATRPQGDAMVVSRTQNVRGAFGIADPSIILGRSVLLVDDVFTSGATARACARLLHEAGASSIRMLVACES